MGFSAAFSQKFEVVRTLGQGGMGQVLLAKSRSDGRSVAIKVISGSSFSDDEARRRFLMEAAVTARLDHPAIIRVIDHGTDGDQLYIVLELVAGGDLDALVRQGPLPPPAFWRVALPLVDGFAHAHAHGVLHRDIKPANVLLDEAGNPKIADFGIAKDLTGAGVRTATGVIMGTPAYMAPELAKGAKASAASDQYAVGVLLYELLTGTRPFLAAEPLALLRAHIEDSVPTFGNLRSDAPPALEALVRRMLEKDPAARYPDLAAVGAELAALRASAGDVWRRRPTRRTKGTAALSAATAPSLPPQAAGPGWALRALVAGVALLVVAGVAWSALRRPAAPVEPPPIELRVLRQVERVRISWTPPERVTRALLRFEGVSREASEVTSFEVERVPERTLEAQLELVFPGGATLARKLTLGSVSPDGVLADLRRLRTAGWESSKAREPVVCMAFGHALAGKGKAFDDRHPPLDLLPARAATAAQASGLAALLEQHRERGLVDLLERTASVLDANSAGVDSMLAILNQVHGLNDLYGLADLHGLVPANEPLRFLFACGPGPMDTRRGPVLNGAGDYRRSRWRLRVMEDGDAQHSVDAYFEAKGPPAKDEGSRVTARRDVGDANRGVDELLAVEYAADQAALATDESLSTRKCTTAAVKVDLPEVPVKEPPALAEVILHARMSDRVHVDLMIEENHAAESLCFRFPTGYRDRFLIEKKAYLVWQIPSRVLLSHKQRCDVWLRAHAAPGEGLFGDMLAKHFHAWEAEVGWVFLNLVHDPRDYFAR